MLRPVQPMLAQTAADVTEALALATGAKGDQPPGPVSVEWKLDGARIQVHRKGDEVGIWTRNLNEVTDRLPGIVALVRSLPATSLVLDGEAVGVGEDELPRTFQDTMSAFGQDAAGGAGAGLESRFFDILHLDGDDLIDRPLTDRLAALERVAGPWRIPGVITTDAGRGAAGARRGAGPRPRGRDGQGRRPRRTRPAAGAGRGARSSRSTPSTWSCWASSGAAGGAGAGCPTSTWGRATPTPASS